MSNLEKSAKTDTKGMIITLVLYAVGAVSVPYVKVAGWLGGGKELEWYLAFAFKTLCSALPIYLMFQFGFKNAAMKFCGGAKGILLCVPAFLVALDNFPFLPLLSGDLAFNRHIGGLLPYILYCVSIGIMEETIFRGTIFPLFLYKFSRDKKGVFFAIAASSAIFGAMHLLNFFGGFSPAVFLQVGYSFLIGCMCALTFLFSGNIIVPAIVHAIFDVGGFLTDSGFCSGTLWTKGNVILTAVLSVVLAAVLTAEFFKTDFGGFYESLRLNEKPIEKSSDGQEKPIEKSDGKPGKTD